MILFNPQVLSRIIRRCNTSSITTNNHKTYQIQHKQHDRGQANFGMRLPNFSWKISINVYPTIVCQIFRKPKLIGLFLGAIMKNK
jgi:hypothetical protein